MHVPFAYKDWEVTCCPVVVRKLLLLFFKERLAGKLLAE